MRVDIICLGYSRDQHFAWPLGSIKSVEANTEAIAKLMEMSGGGSKTQWWLFWDRSLGLPDPQLVGELVDAPGDLWHAGLQLGMDGLPTIIQFVVPTWMLNKDPPPSIPATSWRLSLRACLINRSVIHTLGGIDPRFRTLDAAGLEMGFRYIKSGVLTRYAPRLVDSSSAALNTTIPFEDELRFCLRSFGKTWSWWACMRAVLARQTTVREVVKAWRDISGETGSKVERSWSPPTTAEAFPTPRSERVSVLIPTLDRYSYLRTVIAQLSEQTVPPAEVIVIDQTPLDRRQTTIAERDSPDIPLRVFYQEQTGQSTARNTGLRAAIGDYVLFLDDDVEIQPDLIERHLDTLSHLRADVSSGVALEVGAGPLPPDYRLLRASDGFPTNNTMIRYEVLGRSGLFDLAFDFGARADQDLGMRIYQSGAVMVLNPAVSVIHHRAPQGGLRVHRAREKTYAKSRQSLFAFHLPSVTEIYLARRYYSPTEVREMLLQRLLGTCAIRGSGLRRLGKILVGLVAMPRSWFIIRKREKAALEMLGNFPKIPYLELHRRT